MLLLAIVVLVSTVSNLTYDLIIARPLAKTPEQIIDSLRVELDYRDSLISSLNDRLENEYKVVHLPSVKETNVIPNSTVNSHNKDLEKVEKISSLNGKGKIASETPVFVGF